MQTDIFFKNLSIIGLYFQKKDISLQPHSKNDGILERENKIADVAQLARARDL